MEIGEWLRQVDANERESVATLCDTSVDYLYQLAGGHRSASPQLAGSIEKATNGAVTARELRPDLAAIFAPPSNGAEDSSRKTASGSA